MAATSGSFALPTPSKTSQLVNDSRFMSIKEYVLTPSVLSKASQFELSDIPSGSIIQRIDLMVTTAFASASDQNNISVVGADESVIMDASWNDPNTAGVYSTDCYYYVTSTVRVVHDLTGATAGRAVLRLFIYDVDAG